MSLVCYADMYCFPNLNSNLHLECIVQGNGTYSGSGNGASGDQSRVNRCRHWWTRLPGWAQHADEESYTCYVLFVLIFVLDFSLLTMLFPVTLAAYALATQKPRQRYWQVALFAFAMFSLVVVFPPFACFAFACCVPVSIMARKRRFQMLSVLCCAVLCCAVLCLLMRKSKVGVCIPQICCCKLL